MTHVGDYFVFDQTATGDTGVGGVGDGNYYWRKFKLRTSGEIWLSAWNLNHLLFWLRGWGISPPYFYWRNYGRHL